MHALFKSRRKRTRKKGTKFSTCTKAKKQQQQQQHSLCAVRISYKLCILIRIKSKCKSHCNQYKCTALRCVVLCCVVLEHMRRECMSSWVDGQWVAMHQVSCIDTYYAFWLRFKKNKKHRKKRIEISHRLDMCINIAVLANAAKNRKRQKNRWEYSIGA